MSIPVENSGMLSAGGFEVSLVRADGEKVAQVGSLRMLQQGHSQVMDVMITREQWGEGELFLRLDELDIVDECNESDNRLSLGFWPCVSED